MGLDQGAQVQRMEEMIQVDAFQPVVMDGIGVGRGHRGPGVEVILVDLAHHAGVVEHDPRRPQGRRLVA